MSGTHFSRARAVLAALAFASSGLAMAIGAGGPAGADSLNLQSVYLRLNAPWQLVGGTATLTATTLSDVGPTPYYIEIFDKNTNARVGVCGYGTTCSTTVTQSAVTTHCYVAYIA